MYLLRRTEVRRLLSTAAASGDELLKISLKDSLKVSMRLKEKQKVNVIKSVLADIINAEKSGLTKIPSVSQIIQKSIKKRIDSVEQYKQGGREDLAKAELDESEILKSFLPKQLSRGEIEVIVARVLDENSSNLKNGVKDLGPLMKVLNGMHELDASLAPKQLLSEVAKSLLKK